MEYKSGSTELLRMECVGVQEGHIGRRFFFQFSKNLGRRILKHSGPIRGRITDTDGSRENPHPSSGVDGMGGPTPPSVIRPDGYRWLEDPSVFETHTLTVENRRRIDASSCVLSDCSLPLSFKTFHCAGTPTPARSSRSANSLRSRNSLCVFGNPS